jgi:Flp pilus assembly pilin Flp
MELMWVAGSVARAVRAAAGERRGVAALEYAVLAVGIVLSVIAASRTLGSSVSTLFGTVATKL